MMAVILNSAILDSDTAILDSDTWLSSLRFTQKHSSSTLTLTDTNSIWLKLIHSYSTWWWWPSWILPSWIQLLASWIQTPCYLLSESLKNTLTPLWLWLKLIQSDSNSFILTQLDDVSHLEFCHLDIYQLGFSHLSFFSQTHSYLPRLVPTICTKKKFTHTSFLTICTKKLHSFIQTQLFDGGHPEFCHIEFCHLGFSFCIVEFRHLVFFYQIHSKYSPSTLTVTQTNSIWLKLIHSYSTWWWQPSWILPYWILPSWIQLLHCGIQTSCFLLSDSLKNTLTPLWLWLKLIQSDSNSFILTQLNDGGHLEFVHLGFRNLSFSSQTHSHLPRLVPTICTKILHSFILTDLDDGSYLEFCHVWFRPWHVAFKHLVIFSQLHSKTLSLHSDSDSN